MFNQETIQCLASLISKLHIPCRSRSRSLSCCPHSSLCSSQTLVLWESHKNATYICLCGNLKIHPYWNTVKNNITYFILLITCKSTSRFTCQSDTRLLQLFVQHDNWMSTRYMNKWIHHLTLDSANGLGFSLLCSLQTSTVCWQTKVLSWNMGIGNALGNEVQLAEMWHPTASKEDEIFIAALPFYHTQKHLCCNEH